MVPELIQSVIILKHIAVIASDPATPERSSSFAEASGEGLGWGEEMEMRVRQLDHKMG